MVNAVKPLNENQVRTLMHDRGDMVDTWSVHFGVFGGRMKSMNPSMLERRKKRRAKSSAVPVTLMNLLLLLWYAFPIPSYARGAQQDQPREPLGSLTGVGEVYLNDSPAPGESTIFSGDRIRTGETGAASFAMSGKGTLKVSPLSQVVFSGNYQFTAELEAGTIVLNTITGPNGLTMRIGNYVVVSYSRKQSATLEVTRAPDGSVAVTCLDGTAGVLTLEGQVGQFLQAGQSMSVSANSFLAPFSSSTKGAGRNFHTGWVLLGVVGVGAAAASALLIHGGAAQSVSPSAP
jgi:hypothetical protein